MWFDVYLGLWAFVVGACVGSFAHVLVMRMPADISLWKRSMSPCCHRQLAWYENIPLLSFLFLRGRCRYCDAKISWRYPIFELIFGCLFTYMMSVHGLGLPFFSYAIFTTLLIVIGYIDFQFYIMPLSLLVIIILSGLLFHAFNGSLQDSFFGVILGFLVLFIVLVVFTFVLRKTGRLQKHEYAMGIGDPLMLSGIGAFLGFQAIPIVIFISAFLGVVFGFIFLIRPHTEKEIPKYAIPYGPFLACAAIVFLLYKPFFMAFILRGI